MLEVGSSEIATVQWTAIEMGTYVAGKCQACGDGGENMLLSSIAGPCPGGPVEGQRTEQGSCMGTGCDGGTRVS